MRILFINTYPWGTGSFTVIKGLSKQLVKSGHQVKIFFPDSNLESVDKDEYYKNTYIYKIWEFPISKDSVAIPTFPLMITDPHPRNPNAITFKSLTKQQIAFYEQQLTHELKQLIQEFQPDVIECHHIWLSSWVLYQMNVNYTVVAHHSDQLGLKYYPAIAEKVCASAHGAKKIIAISESVKHEVMRLYHIQEKQIVVLSNGYDDSIFKKRPVMRDSFLAELGVHIEPDIPIISFAGKISRTKGVDFILAANKLLQSQINVHFIMMGSGSIEEFCEKLDPERIDLNNMHFIGQQIPERVAKVHNISKLSVMPSCSEGFGISGLEAMGCGLPVVVTRCGGPEQFAVGKILERKDPVLLAQAILDLLALSEVEYHNLSLEATHAAEQYSWERITKQHLELYAELLNNKN